MALFPGRSRSDLSRSEASSAGYSGTLALPRWARCIARSVAESHPAALDVEAEVQAESVGKVHQSRHGRLMVTRLQPGDVRGRRRRGIPRVASAATRPSMKALGDWSQHRGS